MNKMFSVNYTTRNGSSSVFSSSSYSEALRYFECEKEKLSLNTPADISGWGDSDKAWASVYFVELIEYVAAEDGDIVNIISLASTNYYYI